MDDYKQIVDGESENKNPNWQRTEIRKGFREEVDDYLQEKFHEKMKREVEERKNKSFLEAVSEKKKQHLA